MERSEVRDKIKDAIQARDHKRTASLAAVLIAFAVDEFLEAKADG